MKQHLGPTKQKATTNAQFANNGEETNLCAALTTLTKQLSQQMAAIQQQLSALTAKQCNVKPPVAACPAPKLYGPKKVGKNPKPSVSSPKPGFCFRCGEDGHIKPQCENAPNSALVSAKRKQFDNKQKWQKQKSSASEDFN